MTQIMGISSAAISTNKLPEADTGGVLGFFGDLIDVVNPLQHIPIVSNIYRAITGDSISSIANIAGGFLFGGPVGAGTAAATEVAKAAFSDDKPEQMAYNDLATASGASQAYKMRVTTQDWIYPKSYSVV